MTSITVKLAPFVIPNSVMPVVTPGVRQSGWTPSAGYPLQDLDIQTLSTLCDDFRKAVFLKAGKDGEDHRAQSVVLTEVVSERDALRAEQSVQNYAYNTLYAQFDALRAEIHAQKIAPPAVILQAPTLALRDVIAERDRQRVDREYTIQHNHRAALVRAGALILAAIERFDNQSSEIK